MNLTLELASNTHAYLCEMHVKLSFTWIKCLQYIYIYMNEM